MEMPTLPKIGLSTYLNYALGRVWFYNPITAGFTVLPPRPTTSTSWFLAPMDQTHTLTSGFTYRHRPTGLWASMAFEYGSGTPTGHGAGDHEHEAEEAEHSHETVEGIPARVPEHFTQSFTIGWDAFSNGERTRVGFQFNIENLSNNIYIVARESPFTPGQYSMPREFSGSIKFHF